MSNIQMMNGYQYISIFGDVMSFSITCKDKAGTYAYILNAWYLFEIADM